MTNVTTGLRTLEDGPESYRREYPSPGGLSAPMATLAAATPASTTTATTTTGGSPGIGVHQGTGTGLAASNGIQHTSPSPAGPLVPEHHHQATLQPIRGLPPSITHMDLVRAYFNHLHRSYPFLDPRATLAEAEFILASYDVDTPLPLSPTAVRLYLIMAAGCEALCRKGRVPASVFAQFRVPYHDVVRICLQHNDHGDAGGPDSLRMMLLLVIYSTFDPSGWHPWTLCGILGRQVVAAGLDKRAPASSGLSLLETEMRHRLYWCTFSIDRLVSVSFGLPFALPHDADVPLPGITMEEYADSDQADYITTLQVARQAIALRQLGGRIFSSVHLSAVPDLASTRSARARAMSSLRRAAEDWFTSGCLLARAEPHEVPIHNTIPWLNVNYHELLVLLYSPSADFNTADLLSAADRRELITLVHKYVASAHTQFCGGHLALNRTTLNRLLVLGRLLLEECVYWQKGATRPERSTGTTEGARRDATARAMLPDEHVASQCASVLEGFAAPWELARAGAAMFRRMGRYIVEARSRNGGGAVQTAGLLLSLGMWPPSSELDALLDECELLIRQALGPASVYNYLAAERRRGLERMHDEK